MLRLNRPQAAVAIPGDQVDACVTTTPAPRPLFPEPDLLYLRRVLGRVLQHPPAEPLEPPAANALTRVQSGEPLRP